MLRKKRQIYEKKREMTRARREDRKQVARIKRQWIARSRGPLHPVWILLGLIVMGPLAIGGVWMFITSVNLVTYEVTTTGTVISYIKSSNSCRDMIGDSYTVFFMTAGSQEINFEGLAPPCINIYQVGDMVSVLYNPDDPYQAQVVNFYDLWFVPGTMILVGVGCCLLLIVDTVRVIRQYYRRP